MESKSVVSTTEMLERFREEIWFQMSQKQTARIIELESQLTQVREELSLERRKPDWENAAQLSEVRESNVRLRGKLGKAEAEIKRLRSLLEQLNTSVPRTYYGWSPETENILRPIFKEIEAALHSSTPEESHGPNK